MRLSRCSRSRHDSTSSRTHPLRTEFSDKTMSSFVVKANRVVYPLPKTAANFQVFRSKPAPDALYLQVGAYNLSTNSLSRVEWLIKQELELDGLIEHRGEIFNQCFWQTATTQESDR